jgi:hypothetical protein
MTVKAKLHGLTDVPSIPDLLDKELEEQRALYRALTRSIDAMADRGEEAPEHWQSVQRALSDHFVALSQGR